MKSTTAVSNQNRSRRSTFPRFSHSFVGRARGLVEFRHRFVVLLGLFWRYGIVPSGLSCVLPVFILLAGGQRFGDRRGCQRYVQYRRRALYDSVPDPVVVFATTGCLSQQPGAGKKWRALYGLNPMGGCG